MRFSRRWATITTASCRVWPATLTVFSCLPAPMPMLLPRLENWLEVRRAIEHKDRSVIEYFRRQAGRGAILAA